MKCAGQDKRFWEFDSIFEAQCPKCGHKMEFFKDDVDLTCKRCGARVLNPKMDFGCATYCKYARECLGSLPSELIATRNDLLKDKIAVAVKRSLGKNFELIGKVTRLSRYVDEICRKSGENAGVIEAAAYLQSVGIDEGKEILVNAGVNEMMIQEISDILEDISHKKAANMKSRILLDALTIYDLDQKKENLNHQEIETLITERMLTDAGQEIAIKTLLENQTEN